MINNQLVNIFSKERIFSIVTKKIPEKTLELWKNLNKYDLNVINKNEEKRQQGRNELTYILLEVI